MTDLGLWLGLAVLVGIGAAATRFNPSVSYRRGTLIRLAFAIVLGVGVVLSVGFFRVPALSQSGVFNAEGG